MMAKAYLIAAMGLVGLGALVGATPVEAQNACGRALMMAGPIKNGRNFSENEVVQKRMLEQQCQQELADERNRQNLAQNRIAARSAWANVRPEVKLCIDRKLEYDGRTVEELIGMGIAPSDPALQDYRVSCIDENPRK
jgi:hypothetical protein